MSGYSIYWCNAESFSPPTRASFFFAKMDTVDFDGDASFRYDSNKSWFMFGRGRVDKTGTDGGPVWIPGKWKTRNESRLII